MVLNIVFIAVLLVSGCGLFACLFGFGLSAGLFAGLGCGIVGTCSDCVFVACYVAYLFSLWFGFLIVLSLVFNGVVCYAVWVFGVAIVLW